MPPGVPFADDGIDLEIAEWKAARKLKKRSFREPWRSVAIAATLMFGTASWLLPDSVADIVQLVTNLPMKPDLRDSLQTSIYSPPFDPPAADWLNGSEHYELFTKMANWLLYGNPCEG